MNETATPFPVGVWLTIDAVLDNVRAAAAVDEPEEAERASALRTAGWAANAVHPRAGSGFGGWPAEDDVIEIELTGDDLSYIRAKVEADVVFTKERVEAAKPYPRTVAQQEDMGSLRVDQIALAYLNQL